MGSEASEAYEEDFEKSSEANRVADPAEYSRNACKLNSIVSWEHLGFSLILNSILLEQQKQKHTAQIHNHPGKKKKTHRIKKEITMGKIKSYLHLKSPSGNTKTCLPGFRRGSRRGRKITRRGGGGDVTRRHQDYTR